MSFGNTWYQGLEFVKVYTFGAINFLDNIICFGSTTLLDLIIALIFVCVFIPIVINALPRDSVAVGSLTGNVIRSQKSMRKNKDNDDDDD